MTFILHSQLLSMAAFVHTVETGSFTAAAVRMGVSKSATGKHVARLEQRLGVKLLNRTTRSLSLTEEGELYYRSCLRVMDELDETESLLASRKKVVSGTLRISVLPYALLLHTFIVTACLAVQKNCFHMSAWAFQGMAESCPGKCWMKMAAWSCLNPLSVTLSATGKLCGTRLSEVWGLPSCQHGWQETKSLKGN